MKVKIHGPPKKVITPTSNMFNYETRRGLIDRYEMLAHQNKNMKLKIEQNKQIMKEIKNEIKAIEGR